MKQIDDTGRRWDEGLKEGWYAVTVEGKPEKYKAGKSYYRKWRFWLITEEKKITLILFPWEQRDLLLALGGKEEENEKISWDDDEVSGKQIEIKLSYQKCNDGKRRLKIEEAKAIGELTEPEGDFLDEEIEGTTEGGKEEDNLI